MDKLNRPKLCIVSLYSYPLFNPTCQSLFGGSEVRISLIAKELAKRGLFDVSMVVFDHGQPKVEQWDGISLYAHTGYTVPWDALSGQSAQTPQSLTSLSWRQFLRYKWQFWSHRLPEPLFNWAQWGYYLLQWVKRTFYTNLFRAAGRIGPYVIEKARLAVYDTVAADIYLLHGNSHIAAELAFYCRQRGKKYIFLAGSDWDYCPAYREQPHLTEPYYGWVGYLLVYAIEQATAHIVQNQGQAELLDKHYNRPSVIIRNPINVTRLFPKATVADTILWVGKSDQVKQPGIILKLARYFPKYKFTMIMNLSRQNVNDQVIKEATELPNVTLHSYIPFEEVERYFAEATLFVNTSVFEGFPNTFLQAAKYGVPIVSLQVDPGQMLSQHNCGLLCAGEFDQLKENVHRLMTTPTLYAQMSARCLEYVFTYHDKDKIITEYQQALYSILDGSPNA